MSFSRVAGFLFLAFSILLAMTNSQYSAQGRLGGSESGRVVSPFDVGRQSISPNDILLETLVPVDGLTELGAGIYRITDPRPMEQLTFLVQRKFGISVSYEEDMLQFSGDMVYASELPGNQAAAAEAPGWRGPLVPRLGTLEVSLPSASLIKQIADPTSSIVDAIASHQSSKNVGRFKLLNLGEYGFSVVMSQVADATGKMVDIVPALDTLVTFPKMNRSLGETLTLISRAVVAGGKRGFGFEPPGYTSYFDSTHVEVGADNEPARIVLARALKAPGQPRYSWRLSTMPLMNGGHLALVKTGIEVVDSKGNVLQQVMKWPK
jgi:hypothetical protein